MMDAGDRLIGEIKIADKFGKGGDGARPSRGSICQPVMSVDKKTGFSAGFLPFTIGLRALAVTAGGLLGLFRAGPADRIGLP